MADWRTLGRLLAAAAVPLLVGLGIVVLLVLLTGAGATVHTLARLSAGEGAALVGAALFAGVFAPLAAFAFLALDLGLEWRLGRRTLGFLSVRVPSGLVPAVERGIGFLGTVSAFFRAPGRGAVVAALPSVLAIAASFARAVLTARFLHLPVGVPEVALLVGGSLLLVAIPFLPGAVGVYEGGMVGSFELLGRPASEGIAYALTVHGVALVVAAVGIVFLVQLGVDLRTVREASAAARVP